MHCRCKYLFPFISDPSAPGTSAVASMPPSSVVCHSDLVFIRLFAAAYNNITFKQNADEGNQNPICASDGHRFICGHNCHCIRCITIGATVAAFVEEYTMLHISARWHCSLLLLTPRGPKNRLQTETLLGAATTCIGMPRANMVHT